MHRTGLVIAALAVFVIGWPALGQQRATLNLVTAGDQNMVDYVKDYLGPMFEKGHPGATVRAVGTGPGDAARSSKPRRTTTAGTSTSPSFTRRRPARWSPKACSPAMRRTCRPESSLPPT